MFVARRAVGQLIATGGVSGRLAIHVSAVCPKGHSKWQNIKATKGKNDMLKSRQTNYLVKKVKTVVKKGGFDLKLNKDLAAVQLEFKQNGLSLDAFNNALKRLKEKPEQTYYFDIIGPSGSLFIIETETDSKNRVSNTIQKYMNKAGGFRIAQDSIKNRFEEKGVVSTDIKVKDKELTLEQMEEIAIELDCEEVTKTEEEEGAKFELVCEPANLSKIESKLSAQGFTIEDARVELRALHPIPLGGADSERVEKFYELLQEDESVVNIFDNIESED
uniref:Translational activator of cytochrome c oxidase 1 n=1 Tax=Steinernema glaseri TaxID=37863 RepID=A0A1I7ZX26_9BILA